MDMLQHLYIKNFVLISELNLDFNSGFSAFIGETGAGKSILIDAISLLGSDRASAAFVAKGSTQAIVEGTFDLSKDGHALEVLKNAGMEASEEGTTFTREISATGKSTARIDHRIVTFALMKDCLKYEIDIHGQRDNQYLLNTAEHVHLLDEYLQDAPILQKVHDTYQVWHVLNEEKNQALKETYNENDLEYFKYEIEEIEQADLHIGEDEELELQEKQYKAVKNSFDRLNEIVNAYDNDLSDPLHELNKLVQSLDSDLALEEAKTSINDSFYAMGDAVDTLRKALDSMDLSEDDINEMEERLFLIQKLKRKYGNSIQAVLDQKEELEKQVAIISNRNEYLAKMDQKIAAALKSYSASAAELSAERKKGSAKLDHLVAANLKELVLPNARFHTEIKASKPSYDGSDQVEFMISMNPGEDLKPLAKTASGGELSRLMLGLKEIFTRLEGIQTVIFDEIDSGVSGPVAGAIGQKMHTLSKDCQVFSVTHLAPVAACADEIYFVSKSSDKTHTHTNVSCLNKQQSIEQLAVIASGSLTEASMNAARELYERSRH
jgi:DNA repair protein RecN (Recombination protein N)